MRKVCMRVNASASAASHWPNGIELTAPRTSSATFAMTASERPRVDFIQPGRGTMVSPMRSSNGSSSMQ